MAVVRLGLGWRGIMGYEGTPGGDGCSASWYVVSVEPATHESKLALCPSERCVSSCVNRAKREAVAVALRTTRLVQQRCKRSTQDVKSPQDVRTGEGPSLSKGPCTEGSRRGAQCCRSDLPAPPHAHPLPGCRPPALRGQQVADQPGGGYQGLPLITEHFLARRDGTGLGPQPVPPRPAPRPLRQASGGSPAGWGFLGSISSFHLTFF